MLLAPNIGFSATRGTLAEGHRGVRQTLGIMRAMVRDYRTDPAIRQAATSAIFTTPEKDALAEMDALFRMVRDSIRYTNDIHDVETLSTPDKTLAQRVGDCDDKATLLATLLESVGYPTRFVVAGYSLPGLFEHVYLQARGDDGEWISMDPTENGDLGWEPPDAACIAYEDVP